MIISMHEDLEEVVKLLNKEKFEEGLQLINNFENLKDLNAEDNHYYRWIKGTLLLGLGRFQESLRIIEQDYQESRNQNKPLFLIDSFFIKWNIFFLTGRGAETWDDIMLCEKFLEAATQESPDEVKLREGLLHYMKGYFFFWEKKLDKAIKHHKKSLAIFENYDIISNMVPYNLEVLGLSYQGKGEIDLALEFHKKSLELSKGNGMITNMVNGSSYVIIGTIYNQKGDPDNAIENIKKGLKLWEQYSIIIAVEWVGISYNNLISSFLLKNSPEEAERYLDRFSQYLEENKISKNFYWYRFLKARTMRSSSRIRERAEAERILKELIEAHDHVKIRLQRGVPEEFTLAVSELCAFYLEELKLTNDLKIIDDIQPLIERLIKESERTNSFSLRAHAFLLNGKISLLRLNMGDARRYLTQAQQIADSHGLQLLAREISHEHDKLLEQLDGLESFKKKKMTMSERLELASMDESIDLLQRKRAINAPELTNEEPMLLLIIAEGGILLFSYPFSEEVKINDELFGGFLSAFTSFSDEILSEGLDRAKFGQYTVLMKNVADYSFCYLFKGQTYLAKKKIHNFTESFQNNSSMMQTLNEHHQTSQVIEVKNFPFLEGYIKEIFTNK
jgi:tetratricopeptide (TPR) repeat protein